MVKGKQALKLLFGVPQNLGEPGDWRDSSGTLRDYFESSKNMDRKDNTPKP